MSLPDIPQNSALPEQMVTAADAALYELFPHLALSSRIPPLHAARAVLEAAGVPALLARIEELEAQSLEVGARRLVAAVWRCVERGEIDARSPAADAALNLRDNLDPTWEPSQSGEAADVINATGA